MNIRGPSVLSASRPWNCATTTGDNGVSKRPYTSTSPSSKTVSITYVEADGTSKTVDAEVGKDLLSTAHDNDIELEGACGGELACSTCHLIFDPDIFDSLPEKDDDEDDMLDLAFEVTDTSRLGCQIPVQENFDGMTVQIPDDGF
jgi:ferredoxin